MSAANDNLGRGHLDELDCLLGLEHAGRLHGTQTIQDDGRGTEVLQSNTKT